VQQSINTICGGYVTSATHEEYIVQTYTGSVISFTSGSHSVGIAAGTTRAADPSSSQADSKVQRLAGASAMEAEVKDILSQVEVRSRHAHMHVWLSIMRPMLQYVRPGNLHSQGSVPP
jgi:hypothetical protein